MNIWYVDIYMYIYAHTCTYVYIYIYKQTYIPHIQAHPMAVVKYLPCRHTYCRTQIYIHKYVYIYIHIYGHTYIHIYIHTNINTCPHIDTDTHTIAIVEYLPWRISLNCKCKSLAKFLKKSDLHVSNTANFAARWLLRILTWEARTNAHTRWAWNSACPRLLTQGDLLQVYRRLCFVEVSIYTCVQSRYVYDIWILHIFLDCPLIPWLCIYNISVCACYFCVHTYIYVHKIDTQLCSRLSTRADLRVCVCESVCVCVCVSVCRLLFSTWTHKE